MVLETLALYGTSHLAIAEPSCLWRFDTNLCISAGVCLHAPPGVCIEAIIPDGITDLDITEWHAMPQELEPDPGILTCLIGPIIVVRNSNPLQV